MENKNIYNTLNNLERQWRQAYYTIPTKAGNGVVNFSLDNFKNQGFLGDTFQSWRPRKNPNKWGIKSKRNNRGILIDTGQLRRATMLSNKIVFSMYFYLLNYFQQKKEYHLCQSFLHHNHHAENNY